MPPSPPALNSTASHARALSNPAQNPRWTSELLRLLLDHFWLKLLGISGFMWIFFSAYFHLLRNPVNPVTTMPLTVVDEWIGFQPWAFWAYVSLWLYVGIPAGLTRDVPALLRHGAWATALCLVGLACFYLLPTAIPAANLAMGSATHTGFAVLQGVDATGNACPSMHVATALFSACWIHRRLSDIRAAWWAFAINALWAALIVYSTLAIKQHVLLDVLGGTLLAAVFALVSLRFTPRVRQGPGR